MACGVVIFDYYAWQFKFPGLAESVSRPMAQAYFDEATLVLDNSPRSLVRDVTKRSVLLGLLVAHIAKLRAPISGEESSQLVGRISSAAEGSVNVSVEMPGPDNAAWYYQTQYGAKYWAYTAGYRTAVYIPGRRPSFII